MSKVRFLIEGVTQDILEYLMEDDGIPFDKALDTVYNSEVFAKLCDPETGLYLESGGYVMSILRDELTFGHMVQIEV